MIQEHVWGKITDVLDNGMVVIKATIPNIERAILRKYDKAEVILSDGRQITPEQRRKIYALLGEIAEYVDGCRTAEGIEEQKRFFKLEFMLHRMESAERKIFSLSNCDVTTAREFCDYLVEFIIANGIPTRRPLIDNCEDVQKYVYACLMHRACAVCGRHADVHHCEGSRIGNGNNRETSHHLGREVLPLCREHHVECHSSEADFLRKYHLEPIKLDEALCKKLKLRK